MFFILDFTHYGVYFTFKIKSLKKNKKIPPAQPLISQKFKDIIAIKQLPLDELDFFFKCQYAQNI